MEKKKVNIEDGETAAMEHNANENIETNEQKTDNNYQTETQSDDTNDKNCADADTAVTNENHMKEEEQKDPLAEANAQIEELKDKYLRSVAEFDNYRKRTLKEKAELILNGSEKAIEAILPVLDDMERAIANGEKTEDVTILRDGINLIYTKFQKILEGLGVKLIDTDNADFNTDVHEAIAMVPGMGDDKKGKVLDCVQKGYKLNDKVIRHAKVAVGQ